METRLPVWLGFAVAFLLATGVIAAADLADPVVPEGTIELDVRADRVILQTRNAPLSAVLRAIGERAGFETILIGDLSIPVTVSLVDMPVEEALERLLHDVNRVIFYARSADGREERAIARLWVSGTRGASNGVSADALEPATPNDLRNAEAVSKRANDLLRLARAGGSDKVIETLDRALQDEEDAFVRSRAATALGALADERAVPALERALGDEDSGVRSQASHALGSIGGERATMTLGEVLLDGADRRERIFAAWALGSIDTALAQSFRVTAVDDPDALVRAAASTSPGRTHGRLVEAPAGVEARGSERVK